ncbi:MAG: hypothetical protein HKO57_09065, partial [Akkermansiaceae bacterium]|nr:hypothetical protein [Akkermansiaceae bacterium]
FPAQHPALIPRPTGGGGLTKIFSTVGGRAAASVVLAAMVVLCVLLFMRLDKKRTAQAIGGADARPPAVQPEAAPADAPAAPQARSRAGHDHRSRLGSAAPDPAPSGNAVRFRYGTPRPDQLSMEDLTRRR